MTLEQRLTAIPSETHGTALADFEEAMNCMKGEFGQRALALLFSVCHPLSNPFEGHDSHSAAVEAGRIEAMALLFRYGSATVDFPSEKQQHEQHPKPDGPRKRGKS